MTTSETKIIVGSEEWCAFPQLAIPAIKARVDSGAKTSSLHAFNIKPFKRANQAWVSFEVHPLQNNRRTIIRCEAEIVDKRSVKSSSGIAEKRYVIRTSLEHRGASWDIELTLTNRDSMGYRMLLGREAMVGRILVDPSASFLGGNIHSKKLEREYARHTQDSSGLNIGLLADDQEHTSNERLIEAAEERGHRIQFYDIKQCYMKLDSETPEIHYRGGKLLNELDAVIPRVRSELTYYGCALIRQFETIGIYTFNSAESINNTSDKVFCLQQLLRNGVSIPTTGLADSPIDTDELLDIVEGAPLLVKLLEGHQGKGVVLAETNKAGESLINAFKSLKANLLVQEYIREAEGKDIRLLVVEGKVIAAMQRQTSALEFRDNQNRRVSNSAIKITAEEKRLAIKAAKIMNLKVAGVDIIRSRKGPLILDISASPRIEDIEEVSGKDIAGAMIRAIERQLGWSRELANPVEK